VVVAGSSILHGAVIAPGLSDLFSAAPGVSAQSGGSGWVVSVAGTSLSSELDQEGRFVLSMVPPGSVTLADRGPGSECPGLRERACERPGDSVEIRVHRCGAQLTTAPKCTPSAETFFSESLDQAAGTKLVVAGRSVDASQIKVILRGGRRIQLSDLEVGELVKVWGELRGDGVVVAEQIQGLTEGAQKWVSSRAGSST